MTTFAPEAVSTLTDYFRIDACSQSALKCIGKSSPWHWKNRVDDATEAMQRGTAVHAAMLEPLSFEAEYAIGPSVDLRTKVGRAKWEAFAADNPGRTLLRAEEAETVLAIRHAVWSHRSAAAVLSGAVARERVVTWDRDGVPCKARLDACGSIGDIAVVVDIKTTASAHQRDFRRAVGRYGYHIQAAWYLEAAEHAGMDAGVFAIVAVEPAAPHGVCVYTLDMDSVDAGRREANRLFDIYAKCWKSGLWPCYGEVEDIRLSDWDMEGALT